MVDKPASSINVLLNNVRLSFSLCCECIDELLLLGSFSQSRVLIFPASVHRHNAVSLLPPLHFTPTELK